MLKNITKNLWDKIKDLIRDIFGGNLGEEALHSRS